MFCAVNMIFCAYQSHIENERRVLDVKNNRIDVFL